MSDQTVTSTIWIPLLRVLLTGGLFVLVIVTWFNMQNRVSSWSIGFFFGSLLSFVYWAFSSFNKTTVIETVEVEPMEQPQIYPQRIEIVDTTRGKNYPRGKYVDLPIPPNKMRQVARQYFATGEKFTHDAMEGSGKPLTRSEYASLKNYLLDRGLAIYDKPGVGNSQVSLTHEGDALMKAFGNKGNTHTHTRYTQENSA